MAEFSSCGEARPDGCAGLGMNEDELKRNPVLSEWTVKDLNEGADLVHVLHNYLLPQMLCILSPWHTSLCLFIPALPLNNWLSGILATCACLSYLSVRRCAGDALFLQIPSSHTRTTALTSSQMLSLWTIWPSPWRCSRRCTEC